MATFLCPDCKKVISQNAKECPKCGRVITSNDVNKWKEESEKSRKMGRKIGIILGVLIIAIAIINILIPKNKSVTLNQVISEIESTMSDFKDVDVYISKDDNRIICVDVTIDGTADGIAALKLIGASGDWSAWDKLTTSATNLCNTIKQSVDEMGHKEMHVLYSIKNDKNKDNIFYSSLDGAEIYNTKND